MKFSHSIVAGTFDHLHKGHHQLIQTALSTSHQLSIGLTQKNLHSKKLLKNLIEPQPIRSKAIKAFTKNHPHSSIFLLKSPLEPAVSSLKFDAIIASKDTLKTVNKINYLRTTNNKKPLKTIIIDLQESSDKKPISSTRIRKGQLNRQGFAYHQIFPKNKKLTLPPVHRNKLKKPFGLLLEGSSQNLSWSGLKAKDALQKNPPTLTITVGDIATLSLLNQNIHPNLSIIDLKTNRKPIFTSLNQLGLPSIANHTVTNPPSSITPDLVNAIQQSFNYLSKNQTIQVKGEEDLSVLPTILLSPLNTAIFYGQPNRGLVYIKVTETTKKKALSLLQNLI